MTTKFNLTAATPVGTFTRTATRRYTHVVVWNSPRAMKELVGKQQGIPNHGDNGVGARWVKDQGFGVTWHSSEQAARKAALAKGYQWDAAASSFVGVFEVSA